MDEFEIENLEELAKNPAELKIKLQEAYKLKADELKRKALEAYNIEENETYKEKVARLAELEEAEEKRLTASDPTAAEKLAADKVKKEYEKVIAQLKLDMEKKDGSIKEYTEKEKQATLRAKFDEVFKAEKHKLKDSFYNDQLDLYMKRFKLDDSGAVIESEGKLNTSGGAYSLTDYANDLNPEYFQVVKGGTGAQNHSHKQNLPADNGGKKLNMVEAAKILRDNPAQYAEMKKSGLIGF